MTSSASSSSSSSSTFTSPSSVSFPSVPISLDSENESAQLGPSSTTSLKNENSNHSDHSIENEIFTNFILPSSSPPEAKFRSKSESMREQNSSNINDKLWCPCPVLRILLLGTHPKNAKSPLRHFRGQTKTLLLKIYTMVKQFTFHHFTKGSYADVSDDQRPLWSDLYNDYLPCYSTDDVPTLPTPESFFCPITRDLSFPSPSNIKINMMPFISRQEVTTLPQYLHQYIPMIKPCYTDGERYNMCYLTIDESEVKKGQSQRREGLHVESIPVVTQHGGGDSKISFLEWGMGSMMTVKELKGGIYMASNVANSTKVWDCKVVNGEDVVGTLGDCEHLRTSLPCRGYSVQANELVWLTDLTPHESVPVQQDCYRQYFRLVTSNISVWYSKHNTPNPLFESKKMKFPPHVKVSHEDKFVLMEKMSAQLAKEREKKRKNEEKKKRTDEEKVQVFHRNYNDYLTEKFNDQNQNYQNTHNSSKKNSKCILQ